MKTIFLVLFLTLTQIGLSADIHWITLNTNLRYSDSEVSCHNFSTSGKPIVDGTANLSLEVEGNTVISAQLNNYANGWPYSIAIYKNLRLSEADLKNIHLYRDPKGTVYLKEWTASEEVLKWLAFYSTEFALLCRPPQLLKTIAPATAKFDFETEGLSEGIGVSYSEWKKFSGYRLDNRSYELNLQIVQKKYILN